MQATSPHWRPPPSNERPCDVCGKTIKRTQRLGRIPLTCSPECFEIRMKALRKQRYDANREQAIADARAWYEANRERAQEWGRNYRAQNQDVISERKRKYVRENAESVSAQQHAWYEANRDRIRAEWRASQTPEQRVVARQRSREWLAANPERRAEQRRRERPEVRTAAFRRRRERKLAVPSDRVTVKELLTGQGFACYLCGDPIDPVIKHPDPASPSVDHVIPLALGGTGLRENLRAAHLRCNLKKGAAHPDALGLPQ